MYRTIFTVVLSVAARQKLLHAIGFANPSLGHVLVMPRGYVREISYSPRNTCGLRRSHQQGPATASGAGGPWAAAGLIAQPEKRQYLPAVRAGDGKASVAASVTSDGRVLSPRPCWLVRVELQHGKKKTWESVHSSVQSFV